MLARIEPSTFETRVREEEAGLAIAKANVALQEASVARAEANLRKAELDRSRAEELVRKGVGAQAGARYGDAAQHGAKADLAIAKAQVENAKATLEQRQATLDSARIDLERTYIRSPIDGVVIERTVEPGQTVAASMTAPKLFTIAQDLSQVQIDAQVDEADIGQVTQRQSRQLHRRRLSRRDLQGHGRADQARARGAQQCRHLHRGDRRRQSLGRLLPGMTANVEIVTGEHKEVVVVPSEALRFQPRGPAQAALARDGWATGVDARRRRPRRAPAGKAQGTSSSSAKRSWARSTPRSRPSSPRSGMPARPATAACARGHARAGAAAHRQGAARRAHAREIQEIRGDGAAKAERAAPGDAVDLSKAARSGRTRCGSGSPTVRHRNHRRPGRRRRGRGARARGGA